MTNVSGVETGRPAGGLRVPAGVRRHGAWLVPLAGGLVVGVASLLAHEYLPPGPDLVGHSSALWLAFAFYLGARAQRGVDAAAAGLYGLIAVVLAYYGALRLLLGRTDVPEVEQFWFLAAVVSGPLFGSLGHLYRSRREVLSGFAVAALGAAFVAEAVHYRGLGASLTVEALVGVALPFALARRRGQVLAAAVCLPAVLLLGVAVFEAVDRLFWRVS